MSEAYTPYRRPDDLGTPAVASDCDVTLTIDGVDVTVAEGSTVMRAAGLAGINIPKLCATDNSDWATNCPEYKVTAVQATKVTQQSEWQAKFEAFSDEQLELLRQAKASTQGVVT